ncbi:hypothetical protein [Bacillus mesophilum]|uniref:Branched-chain amino acid ABC transporter substrate-binding protein n=1 Tax=Bacillus mesophilum TaxID=1071718 RepID=A0A7V7UVA7_9BACI|nr:hypothetical protein [Bacillus mesophilum]KAB2332837.1 hypothetical protein F7732_12205 [Bacillus mesophilum]
MKKITDERLIMKNLKNIRIAFAVQSLGIFAILFYEFLQGGVDQMRNNPIWLVFMVTMIVLAYLSMNISVDSERTLTKSNRSLQISAIVTLMISLIVGILTANTPGYGIWDGALIGSIIFICGLVPSYYIYRLRKRKEEVFEEDEDE